MTANWRQSIKAAVSELGYLDSTERLTRAAIERMSDSERNAALQALLRRTVRAELNRLGSGEQGKVVWVNGKERREADLTPEERETVADHREATGEGFLSRAEELRAGTIAPAGDDDVTEDEVARLHRLLGHLNRLHEIALATDSSPALLAAEADHVAASEAYERADEKRSRWAGWAIELAELHMPPAMQRHRRLKRAVEFATEGSDA